MKELVSVILPVFKADPVFLEESIRSILSQSYDELELIVMFDVCNSEVDDSAFSVLSQYNDDNRVKVIVNQKRRGLATSLNKAIKLSKGQYIARMDCDDVNLPLRFEKEVELLNSKHLDIVGCWAYSIDDNSRQLGSLFPPSQWSAMRKYVLFHNPFLHPTILFKRQIVKTVGLYKPSFEPSEDYEFYLRIFSKGYKGGNLPSRQYMLREHVSSITRGNQWKQNRIAYFKCKLTALFKYHYGKPRDVFYTAVTPLTFVVSPSRALYTKKIFGLFNPATGFTD